MLGVGKLRRSAEKMTRPEFDPSAEPLPVKDLSYAELVEMITAIQDPHTGDEVISYYIDLIDCTLLGANVSDLIFWPNLWFRDEEMFDVEFTSEQIANYILAWTDRQLPGSEVITLPTIPPSKKDGPPSVIEL